MKMKIKLLCILSIISLSLLALHPFAAYGTTFTLSDSALMSLDYDYPVSYGQSSIPVTITDVAGSGVKFDFTCPDPLNIHGKIPCLYWTSSIYGGNGILANRDISTFDAFALKITLVSATGVSSPGEVGPIVVGALINQSQYVYAYQPQVIAANGSFPTSATSITTTDASQIQLIGFTCNIPYWWYTSSTSPWDPAGARISLLVEPAPGAVVITPEPATLLILGLGGLFLRKRKA
jgi:PEP-CTERM motif